RCLGSGFSLDYSPVPGLPFGKHFLQNVRSAAADAVFSEMVDVHTPLLRELHATARGPILMWITPALERPYLHLSLISIMRFPAQLVIGYARRSFPAVTKYRLGASLSGHLSDRLEVRSHPVLNRCPSFRAVRLCSTGLSRRSGLPSDY